MEITHIAFDVYDFAEGVKCDPGMSTDIRHLRSEYSDGAVHGGEGLIQLGHNPADCRPFLH